MQVAAPLIVRVSAARRAPLAVRHAFTPRVMTSIAGILAETISNVFADDSVSAIFAGENQLF